VTDYSSGLPRIFGLTEVYSRKQLSLTGATVKSSAHELQIGISAVFMVHDVHWYGHSASQMIRTFLTLTYKVNQA